MVLHQTLSGSWRFFQNLRNDLRKVNSVRSFAHSRLLTLRSSGKNTAPLQEDAKGSEEERARRGDRSAKAESPQGRDSHQVREELVPGPNYTIHPLNSHDSVSLQVVRWVTEFKRAHKQ